MKITNDVEKLMDDAYELKRLNEYLQRRHELWKENYSKLSRWEKITYGAKVNMKILKCKHMTIPERIALVLWGA